MDVNRDNKIIIESETAPTLPFPIPGATPNGVFAQLLNLDASKGLVTTIIHIKAGATIPAHFHKEGAEAHYVLDGDFVEDGISHGGGAFFTHAANVVNGPHSSVNGCRVLTLQAAYVDPTNPDFHIVNE
ncbi:MAG: cupin domain-containing protein [Armatimonadetes bacterium]|nr:cupin domain-containing protein [Armatimonadota bacterium]